MTSSLCAARSEVVQLRSRFGLNLVSPAFRDGSQTTFRRIEKEWGKLDVLVHSIAWVPKEDLQGGLLNCCVEGFAKAIYISRHSFVCMARCGAVDEGRRLHVHHELPRREQGHPQLQRPGSVKAVLEFRTAAPSQCQSDGCLIPQILDITINTIATSACK